MTVLSQQVENQKFDTFTCCDFHPGIGGNDPVDNARDIDLIAYNGDNPQMLHIFNDLGVTQVFTRMLLLHRIAPFRSGFCA